MDKMSEMSKRNMISSAKNRRVAGSVRYTTQYAIPYMTLTM